jgi:hypothetical protein
MLLIKPDKPHHSERSLQQQMYPLVVMTSLKEIDQATRGGNRQFLKVKLRKDSNIVLRPLAWIKLLLGDDLTLLKKNWSRFILRKRSRPKSTCDMPMKLIS